MNKTKEENEDDSILLSEIDKIILFQMILTRKRRLHQCAVVQTPLDKAYSEELIEDLIDSDLLDDDSL